MPILWTAAAVAGEAAAAPGAFLTAYEIAGGLVAAGWAIIGGIAYWNRNDPPTPPPFMQFCWGGGGETGKEQEF